MREAFALQQLFTFSQQKVLEFFRLLNLRNFNETLTNEVVSFEPPNPDADPAQIDWDLHCVYSHISFAIFNVMTRH